MSAWLDYTGGDGPGGLGGEELYTGGVGFSSDGTYSAPPVAVVAQPVDAGGGPAGNYAGAVVDIFKYGVGIWNQREQFKDTLDYRRFEATQRGAYMQGQPALTYTAGGQVLGGASGLMLVAIVVGAVLLAKGK